MNFERALSAARTAPSDEAILSDLARAALREERERDALPFFAEATQRHPTARLWQWKGLLERSTDDLQSALASFEQAAALAPADRTISHGRARVALEAGIPAEQLFKVALKDAPDDPEVLLGYVAALFSAGKRGDAESLLADVVEQSPLWTEGHVQLAQLRALVGKRDQALVSLREALKRYPRNPQLWLTQMQMCAQSSRFQELDECVAKAKRQVGTGPDVLRYEAIAAIELADVEKADGLFARLTPELRHHTVVFWIRHLLRTRRVPQACALIEAALKTDQAPQVWPYAAIAWRLAGDARYDWLEGDADRLVSVVDLRSRLEDVSALERVLRRLHVGTGEFLDQSVRGGSQTDGPLFPRIEPEVRLLRSAVSEAVERHIGALPAIDPSHPLLGRRRDRAPRFSGSWSVLLKGKGYHSNHVHPQGWISSALYVCLPQLGENDPSNAGWLTIGEPDASLGLELAPRLQIEPKVGQLVLFPSYMWHGTRPFSSGERLTVAFDVKPPI